MSIVLLVTSVVVQDGHPDTITMVAVSDNGTWSVTTPRLPRSFTGGGDLTAAVFLAQLLAGGDLPAALARTASVVFGVLERTVALDRTELALVQAQDELVSPSHSFAVTRLR